LQDELTFQKETLRRMKNRAIARKSYHKTVGNTTRMHRETLLISDIDYQMKALKKQSIIDNRIEKLTTSKPPRKAIYGYLALALTIYVAYLHLVVLH